MLGSSKTELGTFRFVLIASRSGRLNLADSAAPKLDTRLHSLTIGMRVRNQAIGLWRLLGTALIAAAACRSTHGQEKAPDQRPRLLLETEIGSAASLGFKFPAMSFGASMEMPFKSRFEFQSTAFYSPDRKFITDDGNALNLSGSAIAFATSQVGFTGKLEHTSLWTSQFDESGWAPSAGVVIRNDYLGRGRLYVSYAFPTGCVWATVSNPCIVQSKRLQGVEIRQDTRIGSHTRWGFDFGVYHFCDQSNQNEPQAGRHCHMGGSAMVTLGFEFHLGRAPVTLKQRTTGDNF